MSGKGEYGKIGEWKLKEIANSCVCIYIYVIWLAAHHIMYLIHSLLMEIDII